MNFNHRKFFELPVNVLKYLGLWFKKSATRKFKVLSFFAHIFFVDYHTLVFLVYVIRMLIFKTGTVQNLAEALMPFLGLLSNTLRSIWFVARLEKIKQVFEVFDEFIKTSAMGNKGERPKLEEHMKQAIKILKIFFLVAFASNGFAGMVSFFNYKNRVLPYETWSYWDYKHNDVLFWTLTTHQVVSALCVSSINGGIDGISMILIAFTAGIIDELAEEINSIPKSDDEKAHKKLCECVEVHRKIKKFTGVIANNLSFPFLTQTGVTSLILCSLVFLLTTVNFLILIFLKVLSLGVEMLLLVFLPCYFGTQLTVASGKLSASIFHSNWMNQSKKFRSAAKIFMENTKKPMKVSMLQGMVTIDFAMFLGICNFAYTLLAVFKKAA
jgi:hypothetical protein